MSGPCNTGELILEIQEYSEPDVTNTCSNLTPKEFPGYTEKAIFQCKANISVTLHVS